MKQALAVLAILTMAAFASQIRVDLPGGSGSYDVDVLQYDDGSPHWLTWGGTYRGTWFNTDDFLPGSQGFLLQQMEYWFFEHSSYPWDTSEFYSEIWNGDDMGPLVLLAQGVVNAPHYAPCYHNLDPALAVEQNFWGLINTTMSAGGWPSVLGDNTVGEHSFFSDDMIVWEPWGELGDYFIRAKGEFNSLNSTTWGAVKALF